MSEIVERAKALVGTPFRPQGRDPSTGLDCIGLVLEVFDIPREGVRRDYRLRGCHQQELEEQLSRWFVRRSGGGVAGDVLLCCLAATQTHLAIHCGGTFVHADAGLRKVAETPGPPRWPIVAAYRGRVRA